MSGSDAAIRERDGVMSGRGTVSIDKARVMFGRDVEIIDRY